MPARSPGFRPMSLPRGRRAARADYHMTPEITTVFPRRHGPASETEIRPGVRVQGWFVLPDHVADAASPPAS
jgi:hypothetical protein